MKRKTTLLGDLFRRAARDIFAGGRFSCDAVRRAARGLGLNANACESLYCATYTARVTRVGRIPWLKVEDFEPFGVPVYASYEELAPYREHRVTALLLCAAMADAGDLAL